MKCIRKRHDIKHETDLQGNRRTWSMKHFKH
jgi:hypothetical protein